MTRAHGLPRFRAAHVSLRMFCVALALCLAGAAPLSAQSRFVYVDGTATSLNQRAIAVLDATTHEVVASLWTGIDSTSVLGGLAVTRTGTRVFVADQTRDVLTAIDTATGSLVFRSPVWRPCCAVAMATDRRVLVAGLSGVHVIDAVSGALEGVIAVPTASGVATSPDGSIAYITQGSTDTLVIADVSARAVLATVPVGDEPGPVVVSPDARRVFVGNRAATTMTVVDASTRAVISTVTLAGHPQGIAINATGTQGLVSLSEPRGLASFDPATLGVTETAATINAFLSQPRGLVFAGPQGRAVVVDRDTRAVLQIALSPLRSTAPPAWVGLWPSMAAVSDLFAGQTDVSGLIGCTRSSTSALCLQDGNGSAFVCTSDHDCSSGASCDPFTSCNVNVYRCEMSPRTGFRGCKWAGFCGSCGSR